MGVNTVLSLTNFTERRLRVLYILFERSEFLIDTSQKKSLRVCTCARVHVCNNLGFSVWYYVPHTYVPGISSLSAGCQDTYMYICARVGYVLCATYVRKLVWARLFVPGISRLPRYVYVDTSVRQSFTQSADVDGRGKLAIALLLLLKLLENNTIK